ncbi:hypothetical protein [Kribbella amoyensis]|uniref:hypothetical protein n=1 Tax=Kribbella amoyensis TaxID=996641 RepID=UPI0011AB0A60|nr:hypothetical protein [Kribbella amoyensis]
MVRRPGGALIGDPGGACRAERPIPIDRQPSLEFDGGWLPGRSQYPAGWVRETRLVGELPVTVFARDAALRERILSSAGVVGAVDGNGCEPVSALAVDKVVRPPSQGGLKSVGTVESVSLCEYSTSVRPDDPWPLTASSLLRGQAAAKLVRDLVAAPPGTGPTLTDQRVCGPDPGFPVIVLRVRGSAHNQDVLYRYSGCRTNGTDDGSVQRQLTSATARQIFLGAHQLYGKSNVLYQLLIGTPPPVV